MSESKFPPRGSGVAGRLEHAPAAAWRSPDTLGPEWTWEPGAFLLGSWQGRALGVRDDRHVMTIAGSRAGKTRSVIIPNLTQYPGPMVIIDPKGELAKNTSHLRKKFGPVHVLDPFGESGQPSSSYNPFDELRLSRHLAADAAQVAEALIVEPPSGGDSHWTDSARNLVKGLILHLLESDPARATLPELLKLVNATEPELGEAFTSMAQSEGFDGVLANIGSAFMSYMQFEGGEPSGFSREMKSILSTTRQQTAPLGDLGHVAGASSFNLADIGRENLTIYLVLPGMRLGTHFRWLRLFIMQALAAMERNPIPRDRLPVLFVLEEFAALGRVRAIETAAGYMAGFGVKLWVILQDLSQLRNNYRDTWETFLGNTGVLQAFGNVDLTTTKYLSDLLGQTVIREEQRNFASAASLAQGDMGTRYNLRSVPLLAPAEITLHFARGTGRQLVLVPGAPPIFMERLRVS